MKFLLKFAMIVVSVLLLASIFRICFGYTKPLTLSDLLSVLKNAPIVDLNSILGVQLVSSMGSIESWGVFSFMYPIMYAFATVIDFAVFALSAIVTVINWLMYFICWFIGAPLSGV